PPRAPPVAGGRKRPDPGEARPSEAERQRAPRRLRRVSASPMLRRQAPADLDAREEVRIEVRIGEADHADERGAADHLDGPETVAARGGARAPAREPFP